MEKILGLGEWFTQRGVREKECLNLCKNQAESASKTRSEQRRALFKSSKRNADSRGVAPNPVMFGA